MIRQYWLNKTKEHTPSSNAQDLLPPLTSGFPAMQARFPLTIFSSIIAAFRSSRAVALLFVNTHNFVHHPTFHAGLGRRFALDSFQSP